MLLFHALLWGTASRYFLTTMHKNIGCLTMTCYALVEFGMLRPQLSTGLQQGYEPDYWTKRPDSFGLSSPTPRSLQADQAVPWSPQCSCKLDGLAASSEASLVSKARVVYCSPRSPSLA